MSDHDDAQDYTANGPTDIGFRTGGDGTGITNGVVAAGTKIGVHGIGLKVENSNEQSTGVLGESDDGFGVSGLSTGPAGVGVFGSAETYGVEGSSQEGAGVHGGGKTGVHGDGFGDQDSIGVQGVSGEGRGVFGDSTHGIGIDGHSGKGAGVRGRSDGTYGGVFTSHFAQIRLEPAASTFGPPKDGNLHVMGEFFVDARGALFYCEGGSPARWTQLAGPSWLRDTISGVFNGLRALLGP